MIVQDVIGSISLGLIDTSKPLSWNVSQTLFGGGSSFSVAAEGNVVPEVLRGLVKKQPRSMEAGV